MANKTNKDKQRILDKQKWLESETQGFDMSGCMLYCEKCEYANHDTDYGYCKASQEQRVSESLCAKASNRIKKVK
jgi:hypothetical protein